MSLISEPSMRWYGMKNDRSNFVALKIPICACDSSRKPLKSIGHENTQTSIKNMSLKDTVVLTSDSEDETESTALLGRTVSLRCDEKKHMSNTKSGKSNKCRTLKEEDISKTRSSICRTKLKDKDISQLLDDDNTNDIIFMHNKVIDKHVSDQNLQLSSHQKACESSGNTVSHAKTSEADSTDVEMEQMQRSSIRKCDRKLKINSIKDISDKADCKRKNFDLLSTLASPSKTVLLNKQHPGQWSENSEDCTKWKRVCERSLHVSLKASLLRDSVDTCVSASLSTRGSASLPAVQHIDDKLAKSSNSESCTSKLTPVYHTSAKKKLFYEDSGTKRKFLCGDSPDRCNITDTNPVLKDERNAGPGKEDGRTELSTPKVGCSSNNSNCLEPVPNSKTVNYDLESPKNSKTLNRFRDHLQKNVSSKSCCCCSMVTAF
jgi:hypothetical protein